MTYLHLTTDERICIAQMLRKEENPGEIAIVLGRNRSTIYREIHRNYSHESLAGPGYYPHSAQWRYRDRKKRCHRAANVPEETKKYIETRLRETWSPEQISCAAAPCSMPSFKTIYRWLDQGLLCAGESGFLRRKGRKARIGETRGKMNFGTPIKERDRSVYKRKEFGHWEADTVVSGKRKSKACLVVLAERKSRLYLAAPVPNRTAEATTRALIKILRAFPSPFVKTITCDRGKEFCGFKNVEDALHCRMYFADPFCAWQKGTVENSNGLLRQFLPKGCSLDISRKKLNRFISLINHRPRKCNGFVTPLEMTKKYLEKVALDLTI